MALGEKRLALIGDLLYLGITNDINSFTNEIGKFVKQIYGFADTVISVIEKINKLDIDESELKQKRRECVVKLETAGTSANTFIESAKNFFIYADLDPDQEATIKEYYRTGNYEGIKSHINKVQAFLEQTHECYEEFMKKFSEAKASCDGITEKCAAKKTDARNKKIAARVAGGGVAVAGAGAGVVGVGVAASLVAGVFTFGTGTAVGLAITGAAAGVVTAGTAGATTYLVSHNFEKLEKTFGDLSSEFEEVAKDVSDLGSIMDKGLQKLKVTDKNLDMLMKNHITAQQGDEDEFDYKQFTKAFEILLEGIRKGRCM